MSKQQEITIEQFEKLTEHCDECDVCGMPILNHEDVYELTGLCGVCAFGTADAGFWNE